MSKGIEQFENVDAEVLKSNILNQVAIYNTILNTDISIGAKVLVKDRLDILNGLLETTVEDMKMEVPF